ncbi:MAG TPA: DUF167 family protein [Sphingobium sp.]
MPVRLTPRAAAEKVGGLWADADGHVWLSASVTAPPDKGRANAALIALLAKRLDVPRSSISLEVGGMSRLKQVRIARTDAAAVETMFVRRDAVAE